MADPGVVTALRSLYPPPEYLVLPEVRSGTGERGEVRYADTLVVSLWPSNPDRLIYLEFKVATDPRAARADFLREVANPEKGQAIGRFCSRWLFVVRAPWRNTVHLDELPDGTGLIEIGTKAKVIYSGLPRDPDPMPEGLVLAMLRSAARQAEEGDAPRRAIKAVTQEKIVLSCDHELPREVVKKPEPRMPCFACLETR